MMKEKNTTPLYVTYQAANYAHPCRFGTTIEKHKANGLHEQRQLIFKNELIRFQNVCMTEKGGLTHDER